MCDLADDDYRGITHLRLSCVINFCRFTINDATTVDFFSILEGYNIDIIIYGRYNTIICWRITLCDSLVKI